MILQALAAYYARLADDPASGVAPFGLEKKAIRFIVVLTTDGRLVDIEDTLATGGGQQTVRNYLVPRAVKRAVNISPNLLWDNLSYVFGEKAKDTDKVDRVKQCHQAFIGRIESLFPEPGRDEGVTAVVSFLRNGAVGVRDNRLWPEMEKSGDNISFRLLDEHKLICQRQAVRRVAVEAGSAGGPQGFCLVSGRHGELARLHAAIKGVWGAQTSGANIVSFNLDAFRSQGRKQSYNAPVCLESEFAYTTALNTLLTKGSRTRIQVGDASTVFWASQQNSMENLFGDFFGMGEKSSHTDRDAEVVRALYAAPQTGTPPLIDDPTRFYVLGLAPNASRIAVRFWYQGTVGQVAQRIRLHFEDLAMVHGPESNDCPTIFRLLVSVAVQNKADNIPPNLAGHLMQSILDGTPYPHHLLASAVRRNRSEQNVTYERAALIKAYLVRLHRYYHTTAKEVDMSLDTSNFNAGYRLGRLFAVLERTQEEAAGHRINSTIRDRFYGAASATPVIVFPNLLRLKNHHLSKIENRGLAVNLEKTMSEIISGLDEFPAHLNLADQGRFAIGYYHQRQVFFTRKTDAANDSVTQTPTI